MRVVEIDAQLDTLTARLATSGILLQFNFSDLEHMAEPVDLSNRNAIEQWLRCVARVVPGVQVDVQTVRCDGICGCRVCYRMERRYHHTTGGAVPPEVRGDVEVTHMTDSPTCPCVDMPCDCIRQEWTH